MRASATSPPVPFIAVRTRLPAPLVAAVVVVAVVIVVWSSAVAWDGTVPAWEAEPLRWVNGWPDWLEPAMWVLQQVGVFMAPVVAGLIVVSFTRRWQHLVPFVLVLPSKLGIEKAIVKQLVERERPYVSLGPDIEVRGPAFEGLSFPSGHSTTAFALAVLLTAFVPPRWRVVPIAWATVVAIARLYYGEHNVLDVVTGAALGTAFATVLWFVLLNREVAEEHR
ncbi:MAG: phosphatase PAP2 family protein [Acidimicrobiia bacterium]|nr:phosphatase PAP2 family protein [Acidimicrobiia bacterium]